MENQELKTIMEETRKLADVDPLKQLYFILKDKAITESELLDNDCTELYHKAKVDKISNGELWVEEIRGEVRTGKSTVGYCSVRNCNELRYRLGYRKNRITMRESIAADQTEFIRMVMSRPRQCAKLIDEYSSMAEGGANSSTEQQVMQSYNDMLASDYVDRVNCNPTRLRDSNAFIHLIVIGKVKGGYVRCKLIYNNTIENDQQMLGVVDIYVWDVIQEWVENVKPVFEKEHRNDKDETFIKEKARKDDYVAYMVKKERRQKLLTTHHIRDIRELEFSRVTLATFNEIHDVAKGRKTRIPDSVLIALVQDKCKELGAIYSFYAETVVVNKVKSLTMLLHDVGKLQRELDKKTITDKDRKNIRENIKLTLELLGKRLTSEARLCGIYEEYMNIQ